MLLQPSSWWYQHTASYTSTVDHKYKHRGVCRYRYQCLQLVRVLWLQAVYVNFQPTEYLSVYEYIKKSNSPYSLNNAVYHMLYALDKDVQIGLWSISSKYSSYTCDRSLSCLPVEFCFFVMIIFKHLWKFMVQLFCTINLPSCYFLYLLLLKNGKPE